MGPPILYIGVYLLNEWCPQAYNIDSLLLMDVQYMLSNSNVPVNMKKRKTMIEVYPKNSSMLNDPVI